jgi:hypothetical protein
MQAKAGNVSLPYRRLWLRGGDQLFAALTAEENLFKEVEVSGLLREYLPTSGTLDLATVQFLSEEQKAERKSSHAPIQESTRWREEIP